MAEHLTKTESVLERQLARETKAREHAEEIAERELRRYHLKNGELIQALNAKADFCAMMSHELLSPLGGIVSSLEAIHMAVYGPLRGSVRDKLGQTIQQAEMMQTRLRTLMECLASSDTSEQLTLASFNLGELLSELVENHTPCAARKGVKLQCEPPPAIRVKSDRNLIQKTFNALVDNAVKFTETGVVAIGMDEFLPGRTVVVCVRDTGIGIEGQYHSSIFEPFVQVDSGLGRAREGMGLGLYMVDKCLKPLKGAIRVSSQPGRGSCFTVALPLDASGEDTGRSPHLEYEESFFKNVTFQP